MSLLYLCVDNQDGTEVCMKEVPTGESIYSVLTILDLLTVSCTVFCCLLFHPTKVNKKIEYNNVFSHFTWISFSCFHVTFLA